MRSYQGSLPGADLLGTADAREAAVLLNRFLSRLSVEPEGQSRLIRVGFTSTSPAKAALIANKVVDEYMQESAGDQKRRRAACCGMARNAPG